MIDYCLSFLNVKKEEFSQREDEFDFISEPCTIVKCQGKTYVSAVSSVLPFIKKEKDFFDKAFLERLKTILSCYMTGKNLTLDKHVSIINCFDLTNKGEWTNAVLLKGDEEDMLLSDIPYLLEKGPVYGIVENGKVVSLAGAVVKDGFAQIHIETAPTHRNRGYAKACLNALCKHLSEDGMKILYECKSENEASLRTVKSIGGELVLRYVRFVGRK